MPRCHEQFRPLGAFCRHQFLADYTINMFGFDFRQGQRTDVGQASSAMTATDSVSGFIRDSSDHSLSDLNSSDFSACLEARRKMRAATGTTAIPCVAFRPEKREPLLPYAARLRCTMHRINASTLQVENQSTRWP